MLWIRILLANRGFDRGRHVRKLSDFKALNDFIGSYSGDGVSGPISFDEHGDITESKIYAYFVKNGELDVEHPQAIS